MDEKLNETNVGNIQKEQAFRASDTELRHQTHPRGYSSSLLPCDIQIKKVAAKIIRIATVQLEIIQKRSDQ